jgi:hypothetical protein
MSRMYLLAPPTQNTRRLNVYLSIHFTCSSVNTAFELISPNSQKHYEHMLSGRFITDESRNETISFGYETMHIPLTLTTKKTGKTGFTSLQKIRFA